MEDEVRTFFYGKDVWNPTMDFFLESDKAPNRLQSSITQRVTNLSERSTSYSVLILDRRLRWWIFSSFSMDALSKAKMRGIIQNNLIYMTGHRF
jgi:hypothetical protein